MGHFVRLIALAFLLQINDASCQTNLAVLSSIKRFKIEITGGDEIVTQGGVVTDKKSLEDPWPDHPLVIRVVGANKAELEDTPPTSLIYFAGAEAVTFLEIVDAGYAHELTIFQPYLPDKKGYSCVYTRYGSGSRDATAERYIGIAHPIE